MRTNIYLNDQLIMEAMRLSRSHTKKQTGDIALQYFVAYLKRHEAKSLFRKVKWEGDLKKMREI